MIQKWGYENANELIVDETIDEFESTKFNQGQFHNHNHINNNPNVNLNNNNNNFFNSPFVPQHNSFQFSEGYKYPNPATKLNYNKIHYDNGGGGGVATSHGQNGNPSGYVTQSTNQR